MSTSELLKNSHGRFSVALDVSSVAYTALEDGNGVAIPFQINAAEGIALSVKLVDSTAYVTQFFNAGDNPSLVVAVAAQTISVDIVAIYPYLPATTTINVVD